MANDILCNSPLYDPNVKVRKLRFEDDYANIRLNLLGTSTLYKDQNFWFYLEDLPNMPPREWKRPGDICSHPFFIDGKPDRFDALQGIYGDCWLVSAMEALTFNEKLIEHVVPPDQDFGKNYIGAFHFRFWQLGFWYDVVVDDRLPVFKSNQQLCFAHSRRGDVFWAALLEKAYAKLCSMKTPSYDNLKAPGYSITGLQDLSGGIVETFYLENDLHTKRLLQWFVEETFSNKALMTLSTTKAGLGLRNGHAYTITKVVKFADDDPDYHGLFLVRLMNPWGHEEWEGTWSDNNFDMWKQIDRDIRKKIGFVKRQDGEFWMNDTDLAKYFELMSVCYLGPGQYLRSHRERKHESWRTEILLGEWVKGISAGGSDLSNRHKNPQYIIQLGWPENNTNIKDMCTVVIELVSRSKEARNITPRIGFYIYYLSAPNQQIPLDRRFFEGNQSQDDNPTFEERDFLVSTKLEKGKYCIVPCTEYENEESLFLLRVFAESDVRLREHDTQISKSLSIKEEPLQDYDQELKNMFDYVAQGQEEIDWIGLKELLNSAMNPRSSFFGIVLSLFKTIGAVLKTYLPLGSDDYDNGDIAFSKDECRSMIAMLDDNHSGKLSISEFSHLWRKICFWKIVYKAHKDEAERYVSVSQLRDALGSVGYVINKRTVHSLSYVYANEQGNISLTDFILCGVAFETILTLAEKKHINNKRKITFSLKEWVASNLIV